MTVYEEYRWHTVMVFMAIGALILGGMYINNCGECEARGGAYVQTALGFACVEKK
jgi:hypothetical protein